MFKDTVLKFAISAIAISITSLSYGQNFTIVNLESLPADLTASTQIRVDLNGKKCGLIKVQCVLDDIQFSGNIVGNAEHKDGEYWVYMTDGSKQLSIKHPKILPLDIDFFTHLQSVIKSGNTYRLILSIPEALYSSILAQPIAVPMHSQDVGVVLEAMNTTISGVVTDSKDGEPLIGCSVLLKDTYNAAVSDIDGNFTLNNIKPGATLQVSYVGFKQKEITFTGMIPPKYNITLKEGRGKEREEYYYDPNDTAEYFDLSGNKLPQRPSKKGTYIRVANGKVDKFSVK